MQREAASLKPGRYVVRGGPGGYFAVTKPRADRYAVENGRVVHHVASASYTDRWPVLARVRVRRGQRVTHYGMLRAVGRVWELS